MTQANPDSMTLGQLCRQVGLARSSVLHYEMLQLLAPSGRTAAGYRRYGAAGLARLRTIRRLRDAGLTLADIRALLVPPGDSATSRPVALLEKRLLELCQEAARLPPSSGFWPACWQRPSSATGVSRSIRPPG